MSKGREISLWLEKSSCCTCLQERRQTLFKNCRPIYLLPIYGKIFERLIYYEFFTSLLIITWFFLTSQKLHLVTSALINKLLLHVKYISSYGLEVRSVGIFLDTSKSFNKVWHEELFLKLSLNGVYRNILKLLCVFIYFRKQQIVLKE